MYSIAKLFLDARTQEKIVLIAGGTADSTNSSELPVELLKYIDADNLPIYVGGTNTDPPIDIIETILQVSSSQQSSMN